MKSSTSPLWAPPWRRSPNRSKIFQNQDFLKNHFFSRKNQNFKNPFLQFKTPYLRMITSNFQPLTPSDGRVLIVASPLGRSDPTWLDHGRSRGFYQGFPSEITYSCGGPLFEPPSGGATIISRPSVGVRSWKFEVITLRCDV